MSKGLKKLVLWIRGFVCAGFESRIHESSLSGFESDESIGKPVYVVDFWIVGKVWQIGTQIEALDELI